MTFIFSVVRWGVAQNVPTPYDSVAVKPRLEFFDNNTEECPTYYARTKKITVNGTRINFYGCSATRRNRYEFIGVWGISTRLSFTNALISVCNYDVSDVLFKCPFMGGLSACDFELVYDDLLYGNDCVLPYTIFRRRRA